MQRRQVLGWLGALALARRARAAREQRIASIGLQLYTVRQALEAQFDATLAKVAAVGYRQVEFAGYFGHAPAAVRAALDRAGLSAPSAHVAIESLEADWPRTLEAAAVMGHCYLIVGWPGPMTRLDDYRRLAQRLNAAGERAAKSGIRCGYHNHDIEFAPLEGEVPYQVLLAGTDPKYVCFEMDLYWIRKGGGDALAYFARSPHRFELVHVKDADAKTGAIADVGAGVIDWRRLFAQSGQAGIHYYFVENDNAPDPFASIAASYAYLSELRF